MAKMLTQKEFLDALWLEFHTKTLYANGAFGAPLTQRSKDRYHVNAPVDPNTYLFDCCGSQKAPGWGWDKSNAVYGGAEWKKDGFYCYLNDKGELCECNDNAINLCYDVSTDFSKIDPLEAVWIPGHIGTYIGSGLVIECTTDWEGCVMITACNRDIPGFHRRNWKKHGKLPWIKYGKYIEPVMTYQTFDLPREEWLPLVTDLKDYAGIFGDAVSGFRATPSIGKLDYWTKTDPDFWSGGTYNGSTAGILTKPIVALMMKYDKSQVHYRVRTKEGKWLGVISACNPGNYENGYAGDDKNAIDAVYIWADPIFEDEQPVEVPNDDVETPAETVETPAETAETPAGTAEPPENKMSKIKKWIMRFLRWILKFFEEEDEQ